MTAATSVLDPTAEPLLDVPDRRVCEMWTNEGGPTIETARFVRCFKPAAWVLHISYPCGHYPVEAQFTCSPCKTRLDADGYDIGCGVERPECQVKANVRWMERL